MLGVVAHKWLQANDAMDFALLAGIGLGLVGGLILYPIIGARVRGKAGDSILDKN